MLQAWPCVAVPVDAAAQQPRARLLALASPLWYLGDPSASQQVLYAVAFSLVQQQLQQLLLLLLLLLQQHLGLLSLTQLLLLLLYLHCDTP